LKKVKGKLHEEERISKEKMTVTKLRQEQGLVKIPEPGDKHVFCGVCSMNYSDYKVHVASIQHKTAVGMDYLYADIDVLIDEFSSIVEQKALHTCQTLT